MKKIGIILVLGFYFCNSAIAQPVITSFSPQTGALGTKVTIVGTNFGSTIAQNLVYFGPVRAAVTSASATGLTVYVPMGAALAPITVFSNGLSTHTSNAFVVTRGDVQTISASSFAAHTDFAVSSSTSTLSLADYDNNGIIDVTVGTGVTNNQNFSGFRNTSDCKNLSFGTEQTFFTFESQFLTGSAIGDLDGDGRLEAVVSEPSARRVAVFPNLSNPGSLSFNNGQGLTALGLPTGDVQIADLDGDGRLDIVVALFNALAPTGGVAIYRNTSMSLGSFTFSAPQVILFSANPTKVALADLDNDGKPEIIITDGVSNVRVRRNKSTAGTLDNTSFEPELVFATAASPADIRVSDLDGDGKPDLAVGCGASVSFLRNTASTGTISTSSLTAHIDISGGSTAMDIGDMNGDGKPEVVIASGSSVSIFQNATTSGSITTSSFSAPSVYSVGPTIINHIAVDDVNSDGYQDIVVTQTGNAFSVFLYSPPALAAPLITSFSPSSGLPGTSVTISGGNFGTASTSKVYFGAVVGNIQNASTTQLVVTVPLYATNQPITVENLTSHLSVTSRAAFDPLFDNNKDFGGRIIPAAMGKKSDINIGTGDAAAIDIADVDGDGLSDLVVSVTGTDSVLIYSNKGTGVLDATGFNKSSLYFDTDGNHVVTAKDIDGDGKLDLVVMIRGVGDQDAIMIYHNEGGPGTPSFGPPFQVHLSFLHINNTDLTVADMDGDGKPELLCANNGAISVFKNNSIPGSFCFAPSLDLASAMAAGITVGDIDSDGKPDIAGAGGYYGAGGFNLIRNTSTPGSLSFGTPVVFAPAGSGAFNKVNVVDLDADGKADVSWVGPVVSGGVGLHVMKNAGTTGTIDATSLLTEVTEPWINASFSPACVSTVGDLNGDGRPEIVGGNGYVGIFQNNTQPGVIDATSFLEGVSYEIPFNYAALFPVAGDLDGDGKPEVIVTNASYLTHVISIFRNETYPAPRIDLLKNSTMATQSGLIGSSLVTQGDFQFTNNQTPTVQFGAVSGFVSSAANTLITTKIPAGASDDGVAVTLHGLTGFSPLRFVPTFTTLGLLDATTFATRVDYPLSVSATVALTCVDLDLDGKPDVATGDGGSIHLFRNTMATAGGTIDAASLTSLPIISAGIGADAISSADFDGDGWVDLQGSSYVWRNNSGTMAQPISFETGVQGLPGVSMNTGRPITKIDFNHDGKTDVVSASPSGAIYVSENLSRKGSFGTAPFSTFGTAVGLNTPGTLGEVSAADFDGDGFDDIVYLNKSGNLLQWMLNQARLRVITTAQFGPVQGTATGNSPTYLTVADFDNDGKPDVAVAYSAIATASVFRNTSIPGTISFTKQDFTTLANTVRIESGDLDGDGKQEIVTIHGTGVSPFNFSILKNTSTAGISFGPKLDYSLPNQPQGLVLADLNLDGKTDILITRTLALSVFQNNLVSANVITIDTQPVSTFVCAGGTAGFTIDAIGTTNITYQWQMLNTTTNVFANISDGNGYTGSATAALNIATTASFGIGTYQCVVSGDLSAPVNSSPVTMTVNSIPAAPVVTPTFSCQPSAITLLASGGVNGQYRWYTQATGGAPIAGEVNATYTTTVVTITTSFYVSINNGNCESLRTEAVAEIKLCNNPPTIQTASVQVASGSLVSIPLLPLLSDPDNNLDLTTLKIIVNPPSGAIASINPQYVLTIDYSGIAFSGGESLTIQVCDATGLCATQQLEVDVTGDLVIYNGFSPNGDAFNSVFTIANIDVLPDTRQNHVSIYNRWGDVVFETDNYDNVNQVFSGLNRNGKELPSGTYYYKIQFISGRKTEEGYLSIRR